MGLAGASAGLIFGWVSRTMRDHDASAKGARAEAAAVCAAGPSKPEQTPGRPEQHFLEALLAGAGKEKRPDYWLRLLGAAEGAPAGTLRRLTEVLAEEPDALILVGTRWAELDPGSLFSALSEQAVRSFGKVRNASGDSAFLEMQKILADVWFQHDPDALIQALGQTDQRGSLWNARQEVLHLLAAADPAQTMKLAIGWSLVLATADTGPLIVWVRQNPEAAMKLILGRNFGDGNYLDKEDLIMSESVKAIAALDPAQALDLASDPRNATKWSFGARIVKEWAAQDLEAAAAYLASGKVGRLQLSAWTAGLMEVWGGRDANAAMAWAKEHLIGSTRDAVPKALVKTLGTQDPAQAVDFILSMDPGSSKESAMRQMTRISIDGKSKDEKLAAFRWVMELPDAALRNAAMDGTSWDILQAAPNEVMAWLKTPQGAEAPISLLASAGRYLARSDGPAAMVPPPWNGLRHSIRTPPRRFRSAFFKIGILSIPPPRRIGCGVCPLGMSGTTGSTRPHWLRRTNRARNKSKPGWSPFPPAISPPRWTA